uniref:CHAP domain-containing protein n=2 Tax=Flavobacterium sp. TaxID=239 RepID=UPI0040484501
YQSLIDTFGMFKTEEGRKKAKLWGRAIKDRRDPKAVDVTPENEKNIANWAYLPDYKTGKELGNKGGNDGWDFRGKGLIQLTGRAAYEYANTYTLKEGSDIIKNPDLVTTDVSVAVLSSMAFWKWKKIDGITNGQSKTEKISRKVGNDVALANGKTNHGEKQEVFTKYTSKTFTTEQCKFGKIQKENDTDLKISQGITWLNGIKIDQNMADIKSNYKVLYSQLGDRVSKEGEDVMDCSELVCRFLQKIEWSSKVKNMNTSALFNFAKNNPKWLEKHDSIDYIPLVGDIFIWKNDAGSNGHTGVVVEYDKNTDVVTTIEAIHFPEQPYGATKSIDLQGVVKLKWKKLGKHLTNHPTKTKRYTASTCRFYTPKIHFTKQDKN